MHYTIEQLHTGGIFSALDLHFARFMGKLAKTDDPWLQLGAGLASNWVSRGHICVELSRLAEQVLPVEEPPESGCCPPLQPWLTALQKTAVTGTPGDHTPLVLDGNRLYLYRYWDYETRFAGRIRNLARAAPPHALDPVQVRAGLQRLFPATAIAPDWQKIAALTALLKRFCVISGGPGTGKTTTVVKLLALLLEQQPRLRIALAAPTGKAAARLQETLNRAKTDLACAEAIKQALPAQAVTLHRLLGVIPGSPYFRHDRHNPLALDVLVVDEASMVDLALMAKLTDALPAEARLILLGDREQLASVEAGAVLGDICDTEIGFSAGFAHTLQALADDPDLLPADAGSDNPLQDCVVVLRHSHRFQDSGGIGQLAARVNSGDSTGVMALLSKAGHLSANPPQPPFVKGGGGEGTASDQITWLAGNSLQVLRPYVTTGFAPYLQATDVTESLGLFNRFRVLCAHRGGPFGARTLNRVLEDMLREAGLLRPYGLHYPGRPIMVTENDYSLNLFNGDTGLILYDAHHRLRAWFLSGNGELRSFVPARLPAHDTVFAMTVHKSQGSEFDEVVLVLPDRPSPVLTRELLYTGITRARKRVLIQAPPQVLPQAVAARSQRWSGLRAGLWGEK